MSNVSKDHSPYVTNEVINTASHMIGVVLAFFGASLLFMQSLSAGKWWHLVSFSVYGFGLISLFALSALHHGFNGSERTNRWLRTLDYLAIYLLIGGTITPVCLVLYRGVYGYAMLLTVGLTIVFGLVTRGVWHNLPSYVSLSLYLALGWLPGLLFLLEPGVIGTKGLFWLLLGGAFYSGGAIVYARQKPNPALPIFGHHEIWHFAVLLGALAHYIFLYKYVLSV